VIAAVVASIWIAYAAAAPGSRPQSEPGGVIPASFREGMQAIVFLSVRSLSVISTFFLVKHYFPAAVAGLYAAVALVGRVVYMLSWSVISSMFSGIGGQFASANKPRGPEKRRLVGNRDDRPVYACNLDGSAVALESCSR